MKINEHALCSLPQVKNYLSVDGINTDMDNLLCDLINRFSVHFETEMCRKILSRSYTETHDGGGYHILFTNQYPITYISSIHDSAEWSWVDSTLIDPTKYTFSTGANLNAVIMKFLNFGDYLDNVKIIYTAGYTAVPGDIQQCLIEEVARAWKNKGEIGFTSKAMNRDEVYYTTEGLLIKTQEVLNKYKRLTC